MRKLKLVRESVILHQIHPLELIEEIKKIWKQPEQFLHSLCFKLVTYLQSVYMKQTAHTEMGLRKIQNTRAKPGSHKIICITRQSPYR